MARLGADVFIEKARTQLDVDEQPKSTTMAMDDISEPGRRISSLMAEKVSGLPEGSHGRVAEGLHDES